MLKFRPFADWPTRRNANARQPSVHAVVAMGDGAGRRERGDDGDTRAMSLSVTASALPCGHSKGESRSGAVVGRRVGLLPLFTKLLSHARNLLLPHSFALAVERRVALL